MRRVLVIMTALSVVLLMTFGTAVATINNENVDITSPSANAVVADDPIPIRVTIERQCSLGCDDGPLDDIIDGVAVKLEGITKSVQLECVDNCDSKKPTWGGNPSLSDFGSPDVCNGSRTLTATVTWHRELEDPQTAESETKLTLSVPPVAPAKVDVTTGIEKASLSWDEISDYPDLLGYAIERSADGGKSWTGIAGVSAGTHSFTDQEAPAGEVDYRVYSVRSDGFTDSGRTKPATPCDDDTGKHLTSESHSDPNLRYATAGGSVQAAPSPTEDDGGSGDDSTAVGSGSDDSGTSGGIGAPPPPSGDSSGPEVQEEDLPGVGAPPPPSGPEPESFYGEDLEFNEELNYGDQEAVGPEQNGARPDEVVIDDNLAAGESESFLNVERAAVPIAVGLLLIALGLHLRRWMNAPVTAGANGGPVNGGPPKDE